MHFLDRTKVSKPACLVNPPSDRRYTTLSGAQKLEIRTALLEMQKNRCAYCEKRTGQNPDDGHIEHFRDQTGHSHLDMDWNNMFWSCTDQKCCGKYKDDCRKQTGPKQKFDPAEIIDPSKDDPEKFLIFIYDGGVQSVDGLNEQDAKRAAETLRVFQIKDCVLLRRAREDAVRPYIMALDYLSAAGVEVLRSYVEDVLSKLDSFPHPTAIRHFFRDFITYEQPSDQISSQTH